MQIRSFVTFLVVLLAMIGVSSSHAQDRAGEIITGRVMDSSLKTPIEYATIMLFDRTDSVQVTGTITDENGRFRLENVRPGSYFINVGFIGYLVRTVHEIDVGRGPSPTDLGDIYLEQTAVSLGEVTVLGERPTIEYHIDKKVINVSQQHTAISGTAIDVLESAPSVSVDIEGNVSLRGSSNFTVLIDGRPTILDANDALQQIPASTIENIEIITNPSAKYDPDGTSGIINIVMKKSRPQGISGILNANGGFDDRHGGDVMLTHRQNGLSLLLGGNYNKRSHPGTSRDKNQTFHEDTTSNIYSSGDTRRGRTAYGLRGEIGWTMTSQDALNLGLRYGGRSGERNSNLDYDQWSEPEDIHTLYTSSNKTERSGDFYAIYTNYQHRFASKEHELTAEAVFSHRDGDEETFNKLLATDGTISSGQRSTEAGPATRTRMKLDYVRPFNQNHRLESGYQSRLGQSEDRNEMFEYDTLLSDYMFLPQFSHKTDYTRNIHAMYTIYAGALGAFSYQAGLRGEYTYRAIEIPEENRKFLIDRWDYFPSTHLALDIGGGKQLMTSYTRRIQRARGWFLEPFDTWSDAYNVRRGNPTLKPEYIDSYETGYQTLVWGHFLSLEAYYRVTHNHVEFIRSVYAENVTLRSVENVGKDYALGTEYRLNLEPHKLWKLDLLGNLYNYRVEGNIEGTPFSQESFSWDTRLNNVFNLSRSIRIQLDGVYRSPTVTSQGDREGYFTANAALRKDFFGKALSATLQVRDVFATAKHEYTSEGTDFYNYSYSEHKAPVVMLNLRFNFNNHKSERKREQNQNQEDPEDDDDF